MPNFKAPFYVPDGRTFDVLEMRARFARSNWEHQILVDFEIQERDSLDSFGLCVALSGEGDVSESLVMGMARYRVQCWLEANRFPARFSNHARPYYLEVSS